MANETTKEKKHWRKLENLQDKSRKKSQTHRLKEKKNVEIGGDCNIDKTNCNIVGCFIFLHYFGVFEIVQTNKSIWKVHFCFVQSIREERTVIVFRLQFLCIWIFDSITNNSFNYWHRIKVKKNFFFCYLHAVWLQFTLGPTVYTRCGVTFFLLGLFELIHLNTEQTEWTTKNLLQNDFWEMTDSVE